MTGCCTPTSSELEQIQSRQFMTLKVVLGINVVMFGVELVAGIIAHSTALLADSLDMLGDALVYGFSLYVVSRNETWKATSALIKGLIMAVFGLGVLGTAGYHLLYPQLPQYETIGVIGFLALAANAMCMLVLWKHRSEDINMRSVWLCSRNDIIANVSVLVAAFGVWATHSPWPDLFVGLGIAVLFLRSAYSVIIDASQRYTAHNNHLVNT